MKIQEGKEYVGKVIYSNDPMHAGRCKIKVSGFMDDFNDDMIPWAVPGQTSVYAGEGGGSLSFPQVGSEVRVRFAGGDMNHPEYLGIVKADNAMRGELNDDYDGAQILAYDKTAGCTVGYTRKTGYKAQLNGSAVQLTPDGDVTIKHTGNTGVISLSESDVNVACNNDVKVSAANSAVIDGNNVTLQGRNGVFIKGDTPGECAVNGNALIQFLSFMARQIDAKYPQSPGMCEQELQTVKDAILNQKIKLV